MGDWRERIRRHQESGSVNSIRTEDIIARRVLKGLGITQKSLYKAEISHGIDIDQDETLWHRVKHIIDAISYYNTCSSGNINIIVREIKPNNKFIESNMDFIEMLLKDKPVIIFLCLISGTKNTIAYICTKSEEYTQNWIMRPGATIVADDNTCRVWARQIPDLIKDMSEYMTWDSCLK